MKKLIEPITFFAGVVVTLYLVILVYGYAQFFCWLKDWQTLAVGITATLAAIATVRAVHIQIIQTEELASAASLRRNWGARALIAGPLSRICAVELDLRKKLFVERGNMIVGSKYRGEIEWDTLSNREIDLLARCIEDAEPRAADDLSALLSELQILQARLESMVSNRREDNLIVTRGNIEELALDSVFICARAQRLFHYSRREDTVYFAKPMAKPVFDQHWEELEQFQLYDVANGQLEKATNKWLAPIGQRSPQPW